MTTSSSRTWTGNDDAALVEASLAGDREAFGEIVGRYQALVSSVAYSATGSLSRSEDLAQETFIAAWQHLRDLRERSRLRSWLCGIARNLVHQARRLDRREPSHAALPLETIAESRVAEPPPNERAVTREEADLLWRTLERIPELYREPLVLFYRQHQSVEAVALSLDLTEAAVRQRLSRGRKLLEAEVLAAVGSALTRSSPGPQFTHAVLAALPGPAAASTLTSLGSAAAKVAGTAKANVTFGALGGFLAMLGAVLLAWKNALDESRSPTERRLMIRWGALQVGFQVVSLLTALFLLPRLGGSPSALALALATLILANLAVGATTAHHLHRRRVEIRLAQGDGQSVSQITEPRNPTRQAVRLTLPFLVLLGVCVVGLPWRLHPGRSGMVAAGFAAVVGWSFLRFRRQLSGGASATLRPPGRLRAWVSHPLVVLPLVLLGSAVGGGVLGGIMPWFLDPASQRPSIPALPWLPQLLVYLGLGLLVYGVFVARYLRGRLPELRPEAIVDRIYQPLLRTLRCTPEEGGRLKALVLARTTATVTGTLELMNGKLDAAQRAARVARIRTDIDARNAEISTLLGDSRDPEFREFERTLSDRELLDTFARRFPKGPAALTPGQSAALLEAMTQARRAYTWSTPLSRRDIGAAGFATFLEPTALEAYVREEEAFEPVLLLQVRPLLRPDQFATFTAFVREHRLHELAGLRAAGRRLAPAETRSAAAPGFES